MTSQLTIREKSTQRTVLSQDMTQELGTGKQMVPVLLSGMLSENLNQNAKQIDVACTLLARDYKGLNNYGSNGVLECKKIT